MNDRNAVSDRAAEATKVLRSSRYWGEQHFIRGNDDCLRIEISPSQLEAAVSEAMESDLQALRDREDEAGHCGGEDRCTADPACAFHCGELHGRVDEMQRKLEITDEMVEDACVASMPELWETMHDDERNLTRPRIKRGLEAALANIPKP